MGPRSGGVTVGDQVRFGDGTWTVRQVSRALVVLADVAGTQIEVALSVLIADASFGVVSNAKGRAPLPARGPLEGLPADVAEKARR